VALSYRDAMIGGAAPADAALVRALQHDLRVLGYLARGIDGAFGPGTRQAVRRLQHDLMANDGASRQGDGPAPVKLTAFNRGVTAVTGIVDAALADSIAAALADPHVTCLPRSDDPAAANRAALAAVVASVSTVAPTPFLLAIFRQESDSAHFAVPAGAHDSDDFVTVGLDYDEAVPDVVTSRGYGLGQYTLFHHPPRPEEVAQVILDPLGNVRAAYRELRAKFDGFVVGGTPGTRADDRLAEHPLLDLRLCRYAPTDPNYLRACKGCANAARKIDVTPASPVYHGAAETYGQATKYDVTSYAGLPDRADFQCDWPYAVRRYNGGGPNSFNYQAHILRGLLAGPSIAPGDPP